MPGATAVEVEDELVEIGLRTRAAQAVADAQGSDPCEKIVQPSAPVRPIRRGMIGPGLLAHILVSNWRARQKASTPYGQRGRW